MYCLLAAILLLTFNSCDKDDIIISSFFECELNGVKFKTDNPVMTFPNGRPSPITNYYVGEDKWAFSFSTTIKPNEETVDMPYYDLRSFIYLKEPLKIGEKYSFPVLPGKEHSISYVSVADELVENQISYVTFSLSGDWGNLSFGSGYIQLTELSEEGKWLKGIVEYEFVSPIEQDEKREQIKLKGEFCSILDQNVY